MLCMEVGEFLNNKLPPCRRDYFHDLGYRGMFRELYVCVKCKLKHTGLYLELCSKCAHSIPFGTTPFWNYDYIPMGNGGYIKNPNKNMGLQKFFAKFGD